jgi:hypothetical protein
MKKFTLVVIAFWHLLSLNAQIGDFGQRWFIGGQFESTQSYQNHKDGYRSETDNNGINLSAFLGKELNRHWMMGVQIGVNSNSQIYFFVNDGNGGPTTSVKNRSLNVRPGLFFRYTLNPDAKFQVFTQAFGSTILFDNKNVVNGQVKEETIKGNEFQSGLNLGINYHFSKRFRVTGSMGGLFFIQSSNKDTSLPGTKTTYTAYGARFGLSAIALGLEYRF